MFLDQKFLLCQQKFWLPNSPLNFFELSDKLLKCFSHLESLLTFFKFYNLSISTNFKFTTKGGSYPISHVIIDKKFLFAHIDSLKNKSIMFLDQIITKDSAHLMEYKKIKEQLQYKGERMPRWYKFLWDHITINNTGRLFCNLETINSKSYGNMSAYTTHNSRYSPSSKRFHKMGYCLGPSYF
ncbi:hypothetical protein RhiirC2_772224 [Rhizophagus irregularis]|uniref:Uncharacterized protein n=1 Tax=Rhizophagus irregularis TaxID=588596 RepID=A0A2N1NS45_9GLOM|nr:hypothetical protein RhiirC2_772224 [Rhizophagus irregularis]